LLKQDQPPSGEPVEGSLCGVTTTRKLRRRLKEDFWNDGRLAQSNREQISQIELLIGREISGGYNDENFLPEAVWDEIVASNGRFVVPGAAVPLLASSWWWVLPSCGVIYDVSSCAGYFTKRSEKVQKTQSSQRYDTGSQKDRPIRWRLSSSDCSYQYYNGENLLTHVSQYHLSVSCSPVRWLRWSIYYTVDYNHFYCKIFPLQCHIYK
jgi:hypothetical protein